MSEAPLQGLAGEDVSGSGFRVTGSKITDSGSGIQDPGSRARGIRDSGGGCLLFFFITLQPRVE